MAPKLYTYRESGNCYKVRLLAALLSIQLEHVEMDYQNGEHHSPEFLAINPQGALPVLVDGDKVFTDSAAILVYLAGTYPARESKLAPRGYWSSDVLEQAFIVNLACFRLHLDPKWSVQGARNLIIQWGGDGASSV